MNMISFYDEEEEIDNVERVELDLDAYPQTLQGSSKFKWFYFSWLCLNQ